MDILRFITAGSVDDGKSTLTGRLLFDSKNLLNDQIKALETANKTNGPIDLARVTDGLRAEREQGITIDVAYKYFNTAKRKFIIADTPGHIQYTRNMVTGASNSDLILILIDARHGVTEQTRRHTALAWLLGIRHVLVAVNKMDIVDFDSSVFYRIVDEYKVVAQTLGLKDINYIPISALRGDNIVEKSVHMAWYKGKAVLPFLEEKELLPDKKEVGARLYIQYVIRPKLVSNKDYRGYMGRVTGTGFKTGDKVVVLPSGARSTIKAMEAGNKVITEALSMQSITMLLHDDIDISRGDVIVKDNDHLPFVKQENEAMICWMDTKKLVAGNRYLLQLNSLVTPVIIKSINYKLNINTLSKEIEPGHAGLNDIVSISFKTANPLIYDPYKICPGSGGAILIDETSYLTVAAVILQ